MYTLQQAGKCPLPKTAPSTEGSDPRPHLVQFLGHTGVGLVHTPNDTSIGSSASVRPHLTLMLRCGLKRARSNGLFNVIDFTESVYTRDHNLRRYEEHCKVCNVNCRLNTFACRDINVWNRLPAHVVHEQRQCRGI